MGFFKEGKSVKYKNKDGIEINYSGNDIQSKLTREVISEAVRLLSVYDGNSKISMNIAIGNTKEFLKTNFNLNEI